MNVYAHIEVFMCFGALKGKKESLFGALCLNVDNLFIETYAQGEKILGLQSWWYVKHTECVKIYFSSFREKNSSMHQPLMAYLSHTMTTKLVQNV